MAKSAPEAARELQALAEIDLRAAEVLAPLGEEMAPVVLFHAQQAAEKWLKAFLVERGRSPPHTHALGAILDLCVGLAPELESLREAVEMLTPFAVAPRYVLRPVRDATLPPRALQAARSVRDAVVPPRPS